MYRAVLDTCVLVPGGQRDFLLQLAAEETYAPIWGSGILHELDYVLARLDERRGHSGSAQRRQRLFERMSLAFPGAEVSAPRQRRYDYGLDDPNDGHVVHAALIGQADAVVTNDERAGFRTSSVLAAAEVDVLHPREFAANAVAAHTDSGARAIHAMAARMQSPGRTPRQVLDHLRNHYDMDEVARLLDS